MFTLYLFYRPLTDRVRSTREGYVLTRVCTSIHLSVCPHLGGYPGQVQPGGVPQPGGIPPWIPPIRPGRGGISWWGYPTSGTPHQTWLGGYPTSGPPCWTWLGGSLTRGYPTSGSPHQTWPVGTPTGGYPTSGSPHQTWPGGSTSPRVVLDMPRSVCFLRSHRRTFLCARETWFWIFTWKVSFYVVFFFRSMDSKTLEDKG